jgi:hypothetical protein
MRIDTVVKEALSFEPLVLPAGTREEIGKREKQHAEPSVAPHLGSPGAPWIRRDPSRFISATSRAGEAIAVRYRAR